MVRAPERRFIIRPGAEREATEAYDWYEDQSPGLGAEFLRALEAVFGAIRRAPALYPIVRGRTRRALVRRFPYGVFYAEREAEDPVNSEVVVLAIVHSRRHPGRWHSRAAI